MYIFFIFVLFLKIITLQGFGDGTKDSFKRRLFNTIRLEEKGTSAYLFNCLIQLELSFFCR